MGGIVRPSDLFMWAISIFNQNMEIKSNFIGCLPWIMLVSYERLLLENVFVCTVIIKMSTTLYKCYHRCSLVQCLSILFASQILSAWHIVYCTHLIIASFLLFLRLFVVSCHSFLLSNPIHFIAFVGECINSSKWMSLSVIRHDK